MNSNEKVTSILNLMKAKGPSSDLEDIMNVPKLSKLLTGKTYEDLLQ